MSTARDGIRNYLTGQALCKAPRSAEEADMLLDAHAAEVMATPWRAPAPQEGGCPRYTPSTGITGLCAACGDHHTRHSGPPAVVAEARVAALREAAARLTDKVVIASDVPEDERARNRARLDVADELDRMADELAAAGQALAPQCGCEPMEYGNGPDNTTCSVHGQAPTPQRCPSCDHERRFHDVDGRCWFTVGHGVPGSNLVCPCAPGGQSPAPQPETAPDACRPVTLDDGRTIRVHGAGEMDDTDRQHLAEVVAAATRRYEQEHPDGPPERPRRPCGIKGPHPHHLGCPGWATTPDAEPGTADLREQYAAAIRALNKALGYGGVAHLDDDEEVLILVDAVLAVRDDALTTAQQGIAELVAEIDSGDRAYNLLARENRDFQQRAEAAEQRIADGQAAHEQHRRAIADALKWPLAEYEQTWSQLISRVRRAVDEGALSQKLREEFRVELVEVRQQLIEAQRPNGGTR